MRFVTVGRFVPGTSLVHRLDPRAKLVSALLLAAAAVWAADWLTQLVLFLVLVTGFASTRLPTRLLAQALRGALWLLGVVALVNLVWGFAAERAGWATPGAASGAQLVVLLLRLLNLLQLGVLFTATTVPVDASEALDALLRPLARLRLPVGEVGFLLMLSQSFIPVFLDESQALLRAHQIKVGQRAWGFRARARAAVPLLVPLFLSVQRRAADLAVALDARCYSPLRPRTSLVPARFGAREAWVLTLCVAFFLWVALGPGA